jgi:hypothetical protein
MQPQRSERIAGNVLDIGTTTFIIHMRGESDYIATAL